MGIAEKISWSGESISELSYSGGWLAGRISGIEEMQRIKKYPGTVRDTESEVENVSPRYFGDAKRIGKKINTPLEDDVKNYVPSISSSIETLGEVDRLIKEDIYPDRILVCCMIIFRGNCNPDELYKAFLDGVSQGYTFSLSRRDYPENKVVKFLKSDIAELHTKKIFINDYIFESENTGLLINARLYINPMFDTSFFELSDEENNHHIASVNIANRTFREMCKLGGEEKDIILAGKLLLDSVSSRKNKELNIVLRKQASKSIIRIEAAHLSALWQCVWDMPVAKNTTNLKSFTPFSSNYINFIPPHGYKELIDELLKLLSPSCALETDFVSEMDAKIEGLLDLSNSTD